MNNMVNRFENITIDNILTIISLIFIAIGGVFVYWQWYKSLKTKRAEFIHQILEKLRFDKGFQEAMYVVDYNQYWYDDSFHGGQLEPSIDKIFSYVDYICYLKSTRNISKTEFGVFQYEINRICISISSHKYLWNLYHFAKANNTNCSFQFLIEYGIKNNFLPKEFKVDRGLFAKTLNW